MALKILKTPAKKTPEGIEKFVWTEFTVEPRQIVTGPKYAEILKKTTLDKSK